MANSKVVIINDKPRLSVDDKIIEECAYITYFDERNRYKDFADKGYRLFSVTISLSSRPINSLTGFTPYLKGIFDNEHKADFSCVDEAIEKIVMVCPEAYIFPRVYITMPEWWSQKYPHEVMNTPDGEVREMLVSEQYRIDGSKMLEELILHIQQSDYAKNIIGYHLAGGCTEEWFHFGRNGGICENIMPYFKKYLQQNYPNEIYDDELPNLNGIKGNGPIEDKKLVRYLEFSNEEVAESVLHFAKTIKKATNYKQTVGVFYGYNVEICNGLLGDLAIEHLIDKVEIDFFCSPNAYIYERSLGIDWADMIPTGSVRHHGKLCFLECDIRTSLSDYINNCRPNADKSNLYNGDIWLGPKTIKGSVAAMRKSFAHQYTKGSGMWWFDMWGGWYAHNKYMNEANKCLKLYGGNIKEPFDFKPQIAVFVDGKMHRYYRVGSDYYKSHAVARSIIGNAGVQYETYLLSNFTDQYKNYKAIIFAMPLMTDELQKAVLLCEKENIPYVITSSPDYNCDTAEIRRFAKNAKAWVFCESDDVIYCGNGLLGIHSSVSGEKVVSLPEKCRIKNINTKDKEFISDKICIEMDKFETQLFAIKKV